MKRIIKLTERDLTRIVRRVINERQYLNEGDSIEHVKLQIEVPQRTDQNTKKTSYDYTAGVSFMVIPTNEQKKNMKSLRSITTVNGNKINLTPGQGLNSKFVAGADQQKRTQATDVLAPNFKPGSNITASGMDGTKVSIEKTDGTIISYLATPIIVNSFPLQY